MTMRIIPVMDIKGGMAVRGIAGQRETYRPIVSSIAADSTPASVGVAYRQLGFSELYVADIDAITGREPSSTVYSMLEKMGFRLWIDAGIGDRRSAEKLAILAQRGHIIILGLESLADSSQLPKMLGTLERCHLAFSLDLLNGCPICHCLQWRNYSAAKIAYEVVQLGVSRLIVLDISKVGTGRGLSTLALCQEFREKWPKMELITGGGASSGEDLHQIAAAGCDGALVASALHDGRLTEQDIAYWKG